MRNIIKRILNEENSLQSKLMQMMKTKGVDMTSEVVGGFNNLNKILKLDLDDINVQEMLVKNFINFVEIPEIEVTGLEIKHSSSGNRVINILFTTESDARNIDSWVVRNIIEYLSGFFPFAIKAVWEPSFGGKPKISLSSEIIKEDEDGNINESVLSENKSKQNTVKKILKEERKNRSKTIENFLNKTLVKNHEEVLCRIGVKKSPYKSFGYGYDVTFYFLRKILTSEKNRIIDTGWGMVYDTFGEAPQIFIQFVDDCDDLLNNGMTLTESKNISTFFKRRIDHHKFEKMLRKGITYIFYDSSSLEEFKWKLVKATLENYIHYKYGFDIDELPNDEVDNYIRYMIDQYDPLLFRYYHNQKK